MTDRIQVQVLFSITQNGLTLNDALYFTPAEYQAMVDAGTLDSTLATMQQARFDNWVAAMNAMQDAPPPDSPPDSPPA